MPRITTLKLMNGQKVREWTFSKDTIDNASSVWIGARGAIAEWFDCPLSDVGTAENDFGGEFITLDDEPIAFLVSVTVPSVVDLRPLMAAE
jgi:hypothetical protein